VNSVKQPGRGNYLIKVAHLIDCYLSISEVFIYELIRGLNSVQNFIVARQMSNPELFPFEPLYYCQNNGGGRIKSILRRFFPGHPDGLHQAEPIIRDEGASLLHAHFGLLGVRTLFLKEKLDIPLITSFYGVDASRQARDPRYRKGFKTLFEEGDLFLAEGSAMKRRLIDLGCSPGKIRLQHLGVDVKRFDYVERRSPVKNSAVRVLFCGRFVEKKGLLDALKAVKIALEEGTPIELRIVGDGPLREEVDGYIDENFLSARVEVLGMLDHRSYRRELLKAHVLLQPSKTSTDGDTEGGAPTVLLEAQATGRPVISTTHADIPEYVRHGESGVLVEEGDTQNLARALQSLARDPDRRRDMGMLGRLHVLENYNISTEARKLEQIYMEVSR